VLTIFVTVRGDVVDKVKVVILAAGQGVRLRSKLAKVLHPLAGRPMVDYVMETISRLGCGQPVVVVGHQGEAVCAHLGGRALCVHQAEQLGTGHALLQARPHLEGQAESILCVYGDMPLLSPETLARLIATQREGHYALSLLTVESEDSMGFGRILRDPEGSVQAIVEEADATPSQRQIRELNCGVYCFRADWLWAHLPQIAPSAKGEYYLTDLLAMAVSEGEWAIPVPATGVEEILGINTRIHLARAEAIVRHRIREALMLSGVTLIDPAATYIDADVVVGQDTIIYPHTFLEGRTEIGCDGIIGPGSRIINSRLGDRCRVVSAVIEESQLEDDVQVGPFAHVRPGSYISHHTIIGNFAEVKNSRLGPYTHQHHFSYIGDATVGEGVNIGAGTITCNFDGKTKQQTEIEAGAFIGSDTALVAPVRVGAGARTGAGTVVLEDVPPGALVVGVPGRVVREESPQ